MAITTYSELKTAIGNYVDRTDFDEDELIDLAESRHKLDIRIREMVTRDGAFTVASRQETLPSDFLEMKTLRLLTDPVTVVEEINLHEMNRVRDESNGKPQWFTVYGNEIEFDKNPDSSYTGELIYYAELTALSDGDPSNALLTRAPGAYLYAALLEAETFGFNDERLPLWEKMYTAIRDKLNMLDRKRAGPLVSRVVGGTP